jgi:hypothetical protein
MRHEPFFNIQPVKACTTTRLRAGIAAVTPVKVSVWGCAGVKADSPAARLLKNNLLILLVIMRTFSGLQLFLPHEY